MTVGELTDWFAVLTNVEVFDLESECVLYEGLNGIFCADVNDLEVDAAWVQGDTLHIDVVVDTEGRE